MKSWKNRLASLLLILCMTACSELETECGVSHLYFSNIAPRLIILDGQHKVDELPSLPDTVVNYVTIYRSGMTDHLEEITVRMKIDEVAVNRLIIEANSTEELYRTDLMKRYLNALPMPVSMASIPESVTIPAGKRSAVVPITFKMGNLKGYRNDYLNYSIDDINDPSMTKDKILVLGLVITDVSMYDVLESNRFCYFEVVKSLTNL